MYQHRISTSESTRVEVTACQGDLTVTAWDNLEVLIEVDSEEALTVEEREDAMALVAKSDCILTVPINAHLVVVQAQGDLSVRGVGGTVEVTTVQGDSQFRDGMGSVSLSTAQRDVVVADWTGPFDAETIQGDATVQQINGPVGLGTVNGDLVAEEVNGPLTVQSVSGDAYLRRVNGPLSVDNVNADLVGRSWMAGADVAQVGGDVSLKTIFAGPHTYRIQARGDVVVKAFPGSNATFTLQGAEGRIRVKGLTGEMTDDQWQGTVGDGEGQVELTSLHSNVTLKAVDEADMEPAAFAFTAELGEAGAAAGLAAEELAQRIQRRVAEKLSKIDFEAIARREAERARQYTEREAARAHRIAEKAQRRAERARRKAERKSMRWRFEWDTDGKRYAAKRGQAASEEERVAVLNMLAEGKISAEEAETLLEALES